MAILSDSTKNVPHATKRMVAEDKKRKAGISLEFDLNVRDLGRTRDIHVFIFKMMVSGRQSVEEHCGAITIEIFRYDGEI